VPLGAKEAASILSFCATRLQARAFTENGQAVVLLQEPEPVQPPQGDAVVGAARSWRFAAPTFDEALKSAADTGVLRRSCIEKQIAFWGRHAERPKDAISRVLMAELGAARGRVVEREISARVGRPLAELSPTEVDDVSSAAEIVLGTRVGAPEAARMARRILLEARGALSVPTASPTALFDLARQISRLVHEAQKERGETAVLLGSDGRRYASELDAQRAVTDRWLADLGSFADIAAGLPPAIATRVSALRDVAGAIGALRAATDDGSGQRSPYAIIDGYTEVNAGLLEVIDAIAAAAPERLRVLGVAFTSLMWAKENIGRERAQLAVAFGRDHFAPGQVFAVGALFGAQESFLRLFTSTAPREIVTELQQRLAEPMLSEVRRLEAIALSRLEGGFGVDPTHWYEVITRKVDLIGEVGGELAALIAKRAEE
jgi:Nitrate and nitrite sensing